MSQCPWTINIRVSGAAVGAVVVVVVDVVVVVLVPGDDVLGNCVVIASSSLKVQITE